MVRYERRVPRRKRVGYRVQMDNPIGDDVRSGRANRRLGLFDEASDMTDATLVLLRVENDGSQGIGREDYTSPEPHGLTAVFTDRTILGSSTSAPTPRRWTPSSTAGARIRTARSSTRTPTASRRPTPWCRAS
ncbi:hypothetical protein [Streptomyces sp. NPDC005209]|uniref:hypothetical protein n=1 Tax=Streptomyces sp. NPDC005209 TaxID=3156715 RepID=UPI0033B65EE4